MGFAQITDQPIVEGVLRDAVMSPESGALVMFHGIVRNHDGGQGVLALEYSAHPDAERFLHQCIDAEQQRSGLAVAASHRIGTLQIGDVALVAAVAAAHRGEAFTSIERLVEQIKREVPIWKRQEFSDGSSEWVGL